MSNAIEMKLGKKCHLQTIKIQASEETHTHTHTDKRHFEFVVKVGVVTNECLVHVAVWVYYFLWLLLFLLLFRWLRAQNGSLALALLFELVC